MPTQDRGRFGEAFSWALWGAAGEDDFGQASASFDTQDQSAPVSDLVIEAVRQPRCFAIAPRNSNGRAILVLAGGGYTQLVIGKEGFEVARWLATLGFHAFVLVHRFPSAAWATGPLCGAQAPVDDAIEAMRQIRARASKLRIDPHSIGVLGLSSGGHLAACLVSCYPHHWVAPQSTYAQYDWRPDFLIIGYGPISTNAVGRTIIANKPSLPPPEKQTLYDTMQPNSHLIDDPPPSFLVYAADDSVVPVENARRLHAAFEAKGAHAELHIFAHAPHGFALRELELPVGFWPVLCEKWLHRIGKM